jgi:tetratricopeptide (TPR) repeat protein
MATLQQIRAAYGCLDENRPEQALDILEGLQSVDDPVHASIVLAATGMISERGADASEADRCFTRAFEYGVPLPALLRECGRYFKRAGRYDKAYHCYSLLQNLVPNAIDEFAAGLPERELCRYSPWIVPRLLGGLRPLFYSVQSTKSALAREFGAEGAGLVYAHIAAPDWQVATFPLVGLRDYAREHALRYREIAASIDIDLPPPEVFEGPPLSRLRARTRTFFFCLLADVVVSGKSSVLLAGGRALLDAQPDELQKLAVNLEVDPIVIAAANGAVTMLADNSPAPAELAEALSLIGVHSYAFGHWIGEFLPKIWACLDWPEFASIPILIDERMPPQHKEALQIFVGPEHPLVVLRLYESVRVKKLWICSTIYYSPIGPHGTPAPDLFCLDTSAMAALIRGVSGRLPVVDRQPAAPRLYLARKDSQHRRVVNRAEIETWLRAHDCMVVDFEDLAFVDQLRLIRGVDLILAESGSATMMTFFAKTGTRIGVLSPPDTKHYVTYAGLYRDLGCRFEILVGELAGEDRGTFSDYRIDVGALARFVEHLLSRPERT